MTILAAIPDAILIWPFGHGHSTAGRPESYGYQGLPEGTVRVGRKWLLFKFRNYRNYKIIQSYL